MLDGDHGIAANSGAFRGDDGHHLVGHLASRSSAASVLGIDDRQGDRVLHLVSRSKPRPSQIAEASPRPAPPPTSSSGLAVGMQSTAVTIDRADRGCAVFGAHYHRRPVRHRLRRRRHARRPLGISARRRRLRPGGGQRRRHRRDEPAARPRFASAPTSPRRPRQHDRGHRQGLRDRQCAALTALAFFYAYSAEGRGSSRRASTSSSTKVTFDRLPRSAACCRSSSSAIDDEGGRPRRCTP